MRILFSTLFVFFLYSMQISASESSSKQMPAHKWSFEGFTGTFDRSALQRGYKVYREVCSGCHSMNLLYYRDLVDIGFSEDQVKAIAADYTVIDGPDEEGNMFERSAKPSDRFVGPFANDQEARFNNNGAYPPDLSVIAKARKDGANYLYNLLLGYDEPSENFVISDGMYFNKWMSGNQIAMAPPLDDGYVDYDDGTENTLPQLAEDIVTFLKWSAEPELEERKNLGIKAILFFIILGFVVFLLKQRLWRSVH
jgi:ubiquinol-cytochrome c reductase cytochrome c1 subunit